MPRWRDEQGISDRPVAALYRTFGELEARGSSPLLEEWALGVAEDAEVQALIERLPAAKRQANLVFASARAAGVPLAPYATARASFLDLWPQIEAIALTHATQTNEAARCAVLLPSLAAIEGPVALLEVGSSAGLCLYPDRYSYRYRDGVGDGGEVLDPAAGPSTVLLECALSGQAPPARLPEVVWRAGIDLNPLDPSDPSTLAWLDALIWPEHEARRQRLRAAAAIAAAEPAMIVRGDINANLLAVIEQAPQDATLVVFHSAVMMYLSTADRAAFRELVAGVDATWISNEDWMVFPDIAEQVTRTTTEEGLAGQFVVAVDGRPIALTVPHAQTYRALPTARA